MPPHSAQRRATGEAVAWLSESETGAAPCIVSAVSGRQLNHQARHPGMRLVLVPFLPVLLAQSLAFIGGHLAVLVALALHGLALILGQVEIFACCVA